MSSQVRRQSHTRSGIDVTGVWLLVLFLFLYFLATQGPTGGTEDVFGERNVGTVPGQVQFQHLAAPREYKLFLNLRLQLLPWLLSSSSLSPSALPQRISISMSAQSFCSVFSAALACERWSYMSARTELRGKKLVEFGRKTKTFIKWCVCVCF